MSDKAVKVGLVSAVRDTKKAILVRFQGTEREVWIPREGIHDDSEVWLARQDGELVLKHWCAELKGL